MKVSVVIPVFNEEKYIGKCLESLTGQDEKADEIIIVDNNSTDKTFAICKEFPVIIIKEKIQGMTPARNRGFDKARFEIIARCDADTRLPKDWIKKIKENFTDKKIDGLTGPLAFYDSPLKSTLYSKAYIAGMRAAAKHHFLNGPNMAITKKIWEKIRNEVCILDTKMQEDIDLSLHIQQHNGTILYDKSLTVFFSARRLVKNPASFFIQYPIRTIRTLRRHKSLSVDNG